MNGVRVLVRSLNSLAGFPGLKNVGVIGVPLEAGQKLGTSVGLGPSILREAGLLQELKEGGADIKDFGDVDCSGGVSGTCKNVSDAVQSIVKENRLAITIGGDHSLGMGTVHGHHKHNNDVIVIWVDTHADINTRESSLSGNAHGMPLSMVCKEFADSWKDAPHTEWAGAPQFSVSSLAYIALRSVDKYEIEVLEKFKVAAWGMDLVDKIGAMSAVKRAIRGLDPTGVRPIHISFDIDALDPIEAPSTILPTRGGLTYREALTIVETVAETGRLQGLDMVEIYPNRGDEKDLKKTVDAAIGIIRAATGIPRAGARPPPAEFKFSPLTPLKPL